MDLFASSSSPDPSLLHFVSALFQYLLEFMVVPEEKLRREGMITIQMIGNVLKVMKITSLSARFYHLFWLFCSHFLQLIITDTEQLLSINSSFTKFN